MKKSNDGLEKIDRKMMEKTRRIQMKRLCYKLSSLIPSLFSQPYKLFTQGDQFDHSVTYIKQLKKRIELLKQKRNEISRLINDNEKSINVVDNGVRPSVVEVKESNTGLQVLLITGLKRNFRFCDVVSLMEDRGAEVVNGGYTVVGDKVYYTLHAQPRISRIGIEVTSIRKRLRELINRSS